MKHYRLSFEVLDPHIAASMYERFGKGYWQRILGREFYDNQFQPTSVEFTGDERFAQYRQLKAWEASGEEPVRNVKLEVREIEETP